jgi:hypothetical protein
MLGKLARWLRILGYDTLYFRKKEDEELLRLAEEEGRVLLTRDRSLAKNWQVPTLLLRSEESFEQLVEVVKRFKLKMHPLLALHRCPICNTSLCCVKKEDIKSGSIPEYVLQSYENFWYCEECKKYYWEGTHWTNIRKKLSALMQACKM